MKRKFIYLVLGLMGIAGIYSSISEKKQTEDILLQNVEALATNESNQPGYCVGYGCVDCPGEHVKVEFVYM